MTCNTEATSNKRFIVNRIKLKVNDLLEDIDQLDDQGCGHPTVVQYLTEMIEENKLLSRKCRELAHVVKNLKQEKKVSSKHSRQSHDVDARKHHEILTQCEQEKFELQVESERLQAELLESRSHVQFLMAQLATYKEDFEMERKDRERAVEKIDMLENRLIKHNVNPVQTIANQPYSSQHPSRYSCDEHACQSHCTFTGIGPDDCNDCTSLRAESFVLVPRSFQKQKQAEFESDLEIDRHAGSKSSSDAPSVDDEKQSSGEILQDDKGSSNRNKRKLNYQDSFDKVFNEKFPSLE